MRDASLLQFADPGLQSRYRVHLLREARLTERGVAYLDEDGPALLSWSVVVTAIAAEVGEPEGVCTVVFDLVVDVIVEPEGPACVVFRLDAEPGEEALEMARAISLALGPGSTDSSIRRLVSEGLPETRFPDLDEFEAAALQAMAGR